MNCSYRHCLYVTKEIPPPDDVIRNGKHYHKKCLETSENIKAIVDLYYKKVSDTVVMKTLLATINNIVFTKQIDSKYLLFALQKAIEKGTRIKAPYSLQYVIDDYAIKEEWKRIYAAKIKREAQENSVVDESAKQAPKFKRSSGKPEGFDGIFGGK